jgi:galactokinase
MSFIPQLTEKFHAVFGPGGPVRIIRAPGRVNLIGEHTDYNDGFVFPMAIEPEVRIACRARADGKVRVGSTSFPGEFAEFAIGGAIPLGQPKWGNYFRGVAHFLQEAGVRLTGMDALVDNTLPVGSGLSSSAAIEVGTTRAFLALANVPMAYEKVAQICQQAEHKYANVPCGIMDMTASAGGKAGHALLLDCRSFAVTYVPVPPAEVRVVIMNTMVRHELSGGEYAERRAQCEEAAAHFKVKALRDLTVPELLKGEKHLPVAVYRRARHVVTEIARTLEAAAALRDGHYETAGKLMNASHVSLRDDYEVSCEELDFLAAEAVKVPGVYGARMTGGGFGGCAVALCTPKAVEPLRQFITAAYHAKFNLTPDIIATAATDGAGAVN